MNINQSFALLLAAMTLILPACTGAGSPQTDLNGTSWALTHLQGQPVLDGSQPSLSFENGQASGSGSCNGFGGEYTLKGNKLTFEALMSTMMACFPEELMQQEQAYLAALTATASYQVQGDRLTLFDAENNNLVEFTLVP